MRKRKAETKRIFVFYHADCRDGFAAAWAAWRKFRGQAEYPPFQWETPWHKLKGLPFAGAEIYFLDVCPEGKGILKRLEKIAAKVVVIDHHQTTAALATHCRNFVFDSSHSGAFLSWRYFHPRQSLPQLIKYVQDVDLWRWKLPHTRELLLALLLDCDLDPFNFNCWDKAEIVFQDKQRVKQMVSLGRELVKFEHKIVVSVINKADKVRLGKHQAYAVNTNSFLKSEVAHALYKLEPKVHLGIVYQVVAGGKRAYVSLRSDGKLNVGQLAQKYGGGGHLDSAAFVWDLRRPLPFKLIKKHER